MEQAARGYMAELRDGPPEMYSSGLPSIDRALGGGIAPGEMAIIGARPSHGKTMLALQWGYAVSAKYPVVVISEEMNARALGRRAIQHATTIQEDDWRSEWEDAFDQTIAFFDPKRPILIADGCRTAERAAQAIGEAVVHHGAKLAIVDYAQLLRGKGMSRYEQVSDVSTTIKNAAVEHGIGLLMLAQLNREAVNAEVPTLHHLKDSGQLEQDSDVVMLLQWPRKDDPTYTPADEYRVFFAKNRNRGVRGNGVEYLRFHPFRQMLTDDFSDGPAEWAPRASYGDAVMTGAF